MVAVPAGHTADSDAVVVFGSYRTGHMGTVVVHLDLVVVFDEIPAVKIVDVAVSVVVYTGLSVQLRRIDHIALQVFVGIIHASVHDGYDNLRGTLCNFPGPEQVDIGSRKRIGKGAVVVVMPLVR